MIMKMNKLVTTSLLGVSLLTAAHAGVVPNLEVYKAEITKVRRTETPGKVLSLVQAADKEMQSDLAVSLLKVVADRSHSLLPSTISALSSKFPALAADLAAEGAKLAPEYATSIAQAAAVSAPEKSHLVAAAVAKQAPSKALRVARTVSDFVPERELQIAYLVSQIEPQVARGLSQELQSGFEYINQEVQISSDFFANFALFSSNLKPQGFLSQQTVAQAEAVTILNEIINKAPEADRAKVTENLTTILNSGNVKLEDVRSLAKGDPVTIGGSTVTVANALTGTSVESNPTSVQLDDTELTTTQTTASNAVKAKVKELVAQTATNATLTDAEKVKTIQKLTGTEGDSTKADAIVAAAKIVPSSINSIVETEVGTEVDTSVDSIDSNRVNVSQTPVETPDPDAYGAI